jgi:ABC-type multidrug transport system ATPase subunit
MPFVETQNLSKKFGAITALNDCSIEIPQGTIFGLLGPNGAGKSTFIRLLMGLIKPTSGTATIAGLNCHSESLQVREKTSYLPGDVRLDRHYKGHELLRVMTSIRKDGSFQQATEIADFLALDLSRRVRSMSTGMRQKLALTLALANQAPLIILDEPTSNLDPTVRQQVIELLQRRKQTGQTILFSSHILDEVETVCDQVAILKDGQLAITEKVSVFRIPNLIPTAINSRSLLKSKATCNQPSNGSVTLLSKMYPSNLFVCEASTKRSMRIMRCPAHDSFSTALSAQITATLSRMQSGYSVFYLHAHLGNYIV